MTSFFSSKPGQATVAQWTAAALVVMTGGHPLSVLAAGILVAIATRLYIQEFQRLDSILVAKEKRATSTQVVPAVRAAGRVTQGMSAGFVPESPSLRPESRSLRIPKD